MKVKSFVTALLLVFTMFSCSKYDDSEIWDYVKGMNTRLTALEEKCKDMNTNITSLQTIVAAFENGDYITNVAPVMRNGIQIGYTISFQKSPAITIYNGADGKDGNDGYTPVIGVKQDTDELYYWTIDGEWLLDGDGMKVRASGIDGKDGINGTNGTNGTDGTNGENGITPLLKIENEYWYVSYDAGTSWQILGKATGDKGADGASLFSSIEVGTNEVTFVLTDGTFFTIPLQSSGTEYEYIDLGLPSGTLWATCNVGANSPEEYGDYFAWGEIEPKSDYIWDTYKFYGGKKTDQLHNIYYETVTKYCTVSNYGYGYYGFTDNITELLPEDDAATAKWGSRWQIPSIAQLQELLTGAYTTTTAEKLNGIDGYKITSNINNKSIFLPAACHRGKSNTSIEYDVSDNFYWSRSLNRTYPNCAFHLGFCSGGINFDSSSRFYGFPIRPVRKQ